MACSETKYREALEEIFDKLDKDKSGQLDCKELCEALTCYYKVKNIKKDPAQIDKECKEIASQLDKNKDGSVSKKEFVDFVMNMN